MIYRFRIILDTKQDVIRDIEIDETNTMEDFHNAITQAYGFRGQEMASFYISDNEWAQGEEISLFDMSEGPDSVRIMSENILKDVVSETQTKLIYLYDFLNMWTFMVELAEIVEPKIGRIYPNLMFAFGDIPDEAPEKDFVAEGEDTSLDDDLDPEDYDNLDFDENWN